MSYDLHRRCGAATTSPARAAALLACARTAPACATTKGLAPAPGRFEKALPWRLAHIDSATRSLDLQTSLRWGAEAGNPILERIIDAADRGVKVRLFIDDITTMSEAGLTLALRDLDDAAIDAPPNIEVRVFHPWIEPRCFSRVVELAGRGDRPNQRIHSRALIADKHLAILAGWDLANEELGLSTEFTFRDLDVGPSRVFTDAPDDGGPTHHLPDVKKALFANATEDVLVSNAYVLPGPGGNAARRGPGSPRRVLRRASSSGSCSPTTRGRCGSPAKATCAGCRGRRR
ncbi:MAG: hypothetical protein AB1730_19615 [Myxococcota bacterium]